MSSTYADKNLLDYEGLSIYDTLIKNYATAAMAGASTYDMSGYYTKSATTALLAAKASTADLVGKASTADLIGIITTATASAYIDEGVLKAASSYAVTNSISGSTALPTDATIKSYVEGLGYLTAYEIDIDPSAATTASYSDGDMWITTV